MIIITTGTGKSTYLSTQITIDGILISDSSTIENYPRIIQKVKI